ncbi:MAG: hypothetical protein ACRD4C_09570 [Candidatus Acidiferrales bacterium]
MVPKKRYTPTYSGGVFHVEIGRVFIVLPSALIAVAAPKASGNFSSIAMRLFAKTLGVELQNADNDCIKQPKSCDPWATLPTKTKKAPTPN